MHILEYFSVSTPCNGYCIIE